MKHGSVLKRSLESCGRPVQWTLVLVLALVLVSHAKTAHAHKVTIFAWVEGNHIYTESQFSGGRKVNNGKIQVFDNKGKLLLEGSTDAKGNFAFDVPKICDLKIVLKAGMGHQNHWIVPEAEIREAAGLPRQGPKEDISENAVAPAGPPAPAATLSPELEKKLEQILDRKLHPLVRQLAELQNRGPNLQDILGGIGYILGLVGLGAYIRFRRQAKAGDK